MLLLENPLNFKVQIGSNDLLRYENMLNTSIYKVESMPGVEVVEG